MRQMQNLKRLRRKADIEVTGSFSHESKLKEIWQFSIFHLRYGWNFTKKGSRQSAVGKKYQFKQKLLSLKFSKNK